MLERKNETLRVTCRRDFNGMVYEAWAGDSPLDMTEDVQYHVVTLFPVAEAAVIIGQKMVIPLRRTLLAN